MRKQTILAAFLSILVSAGVFADSLKFVRGDVVLENRERSNPLYEGYDLWLFRGGTYAILFDGWVLNTKPIPYAGSGHFLVPSPNQVIFQHERSVAVWDGVVRLARAEG